MVKVKLIAVSLAKNKNLHTSDHMSTKETPETDASEIDTSDINTSAISSDMMTETDKAMEDATLDTYQKMAAFTSLKKVEAKRSIGGHKHHLTHTRDAVDRPQPGSKSGPT